MFSTSVLPAGEGSVADVFCQNFTAGISGLGEILTVPLAEGGEDIMVTEDNRRDYVELYLAFVMNVSIHKQVSSSLGLVWHACWQ